MKMQQQPTPTSEAPVSMDRISMNRRSFLGAFSGLAATALSPFRTEAQNAPAGSTPVTATPVSFTAQNSADVSIICLGQGQLTFRSDNTPIAVDKNQTDPQQKPVVGPLLGISEGTFTQGLAIGLDAMRRANAGQFPAGATFRLVVSYQEKGAAPVQMQFPIAPDKIPAEKSLDKNSVENTAASLREAYSYFKDTLCVNVARYGADHLQSSFALHHSHKTPARVYILMDLPQATGTAITTNAPTQKAP
jgi:hypothetical protein